MSPAFPMTETPGAPSLSTSPPDKAHELPHAVALLERLPDVPKWMVADRGYTTHAFRQHIWDVGARPAIPPLRHEAPVASPD